METMISNSIYLPHGKKAGNYPGALTLNILRPLMIGFSLKVNDNVSRLMVLVPRVWPKEQASFASQARSCEQRCQYSLSGGNFSFVYESNASSHHQQEPSVYMFSHRFPNGL